MKVTADTNVLVRAALDDEPRQAAAARRLLSRATVIAIPIPVLCELAWVLRRGYRRSREETAAAIAAVTELETTVTDRPAVEAGLAVLRAGGDFADGAIAQQGMALGGTVLATFDRKALLRLRDSRLPAADPTELASSPAPLH